MRLDHVCTKKDKRLLVLLVLSPFILFFDITFFKSYKPVTHDYSWMQRLDKERMTYRYALTNSHVDFAEGMLSMSNDNISTQAISQLDNRLKQGRAVAVENKHDRQATVTQFSPRLAFFLGQPFSINTANKEDLTLIPGVGEVLAGNIIAYRESHGSITDSSQLENIPGIGPRTKQKLEKYFTYRVGGE